MVLTKEEFISAVEAKVKPNDFKTHAVAVRAVDAVFESGNTECISRRCLAELKRRYGL